MNKPAIAIIQARMSSTRLPGKVLKHLAGRPMIWHIYDRATRCKLVDKVVVATSSDPSDDPLAHYCKNNGLEFYRGSLSDVLSRFLDILEHEKKPYCVRITGDCPLIHPQFIDNQIKALTSFDGDLSWCFNSGTAFEGQGVHSARSLKYIAKNSTNPDDREHVGSPYFADHPDRFRVVEMHLPPELIVHSLRLTVDEMDDYLMFSKLYDHLWPARKWIELSDAINWLEKRNDISEINKNVEHKKLNVTTQEKRKKWREIPKAGFWQFDNNL
jgi:spore coat polysaccharide biosynthesis protein SpsF